MQKGERWDSDKRENGEWFCTFVLFWREKGKGMGDKGLCSKVKCYVML